MSLAVVIPWRDSGDPQRAANFGHTLRYYLDLSIGTVIPIDDGRQPGQPFNRSAAYNRGLALTTADTIIWNEADTLVPPEQLHQAADLAAQTLGIVIPFTERHELNPDDTNAVINHRHNPWEKKATRVYPNKSSIGACGVTSRATIDAIGGHWDEGFSGWGYDDTSMHHVFRTLAGPPRWVDGRCIHLWHAPPLHDTSPAVQTQIAANRARWRRIRKMRPDELKGYIQ